MQLHYLLTGKTFFSKFRSINQTQTTCINCVFRYLNFYFYDKLIICNQYKLYKLKLMINPFISSSVEHFVPMPLEGFLERSMIYHIKRAH